MVILLDQDGVLADFELGFFKRWRHKYPDAPCITPQQRTTFYASDQIPQASRQQVRDIFAEPGFFLNLPPIEGAIEAVQEMLDLGHEVRICTAPIREYRHCVQEKFMWVEKHLGSDFVKRIVIAKDKTFVRGDILIDDRPKVSGVLQPSWEHVLYDQPYNREVQGKRRLTWQNWKEVLFSG